MNDVILSLDDFNKLFQNLVISVLGMSEAAATWKAWKEAGSHGQEPLNPFYFVRVSYPNAGSPAWKQQEDVCFLKCIEIDDPINKQRDVKFQKIDEETANKQTGYTTVFAISFTVYGPNSYENCRKIKDSLFSENNRFVLAAKQLFVVPDFKPPARIPELFQGNWWERVDLTINFNNLVLINENVNYIKTAEVNVEDGKIVATVNVNAPEEQSFVVINEENRAIITT
jgi:hypothetical protein